MSLWRRLQTFEWSTKTYHFPSEGSALRDFEIYFKKAMTTGSCKNPVQAIQIQWNSFCTVVESIHRLSRGFLQHAEMADWNENEWIRIKKLTRNETHFHLKYIHFDFNKFNHKISRGVLTSSSQESKMPKHDSGRERAQRADWAHLEYSLESWR